MGRRTVNGRGGLCMPVKIYIIARGYVTISGILTRLRRYRALTMRAYESRSGQARDLQVLVFIGSSGDGDQSPPLGLLSQYQRAPGLFLRGIQWRGGSDRSG